MPVNYIALGPQIKSLGEKSIQRSDELQKKLARCRTLLAQNAAQVIALQQKVEEAVARDSGTRCAKPFLEPLDAHVASKTSPEASILLAADGSQLTPNPHEPVLFGLVNVGIFRMPLNNGEAPSETILSELLYDETLYTPGGMISEDLVALLRDVREREILADLVKAEREHTNLPVITLTDGPLELYHEPRKDIHFDEQFTKYLAALDDLSLLGAVTAGYVDRPRADLVVRLLELLETPSTAAADTDERAFSGVTDLSLFEALIGPGERSAVFEIQSSSTKSFSGRKALHFFYLNVGRQNKSAIARVEIPAWVAEDGAAVDLLQNVLVDQAHATGSRPYPYPLIRAHEIAVVKLDDRDQLTHRIEQELIQQGFDPFEKSNKQSGKDAEPRTRL